ncbi:hypothetical protein JCM3766R1_002204 [Sporobolomyces carnicolor]
MRHSSTLVSFATLFLAAASVSAQSASSISEEMNTLVVNIPEACLSVCSAWRTGYQQCPVASDATTDFSGCTCATDFVNNFNACTGCMANTLNAQGDMTLAGTATQAPTDLANYCAAAGLSESTSSSTTTSSETTSSTTSAAAATTTATDSTTSTDSSSSSTSSSSTAAGVVGAGGPASAGGPFPSQTKAPSAFTNSASNGIKLSGGVVVGLFAAMMMF